MKKLHLLISILLLSLTATLTAHAVTPIYMADNIVNVVATSSNPSIQGVQFNYDDAKGYYYLHVDGSVVTATSNPGDFQISTKTDCDYSTWKTGLLYSSSGSSNPRTVYADGCYCSLVQVASTNTAGYWMTISGFSKSKSYTFYVSGDLSKLWVIEDGIDVYLGDYLAGYSNFGTTGNSGLETHRFTYDSVNHLYTFVAPGGFGYSDSLGDFQISTCPGDYATWKTGLIYVPGEYDNTSGSSTKFIPVGTYSASTAPISNTGSHWMSIKDYDRYKTYTLTLTADFQTLTISEADVPTLWIGGNKSGTGTQYGGLNSTTAVQMDYNPLTGLFSYSANTGLKGRFSLWKDRRMTQLYSCVNRISSEDLEFNTRYQIEQNNSKGPQQFLQSHTASEITIYVDLNNMLMWGVADSEQPYYFYYGSTGSPYAPEQFVKQADGSWKYTLSPFSNTEIADFRISRTKAFADDASTLGFDNGGLTAGTITLNGTPAPLSDGTANITIPAGFSRSIIISADGTQISVTGTLERPNIYLGDNVTGVNPASSDQNGVGFQFNYDSEKNLYYLTVPKNTSALTSGDFQISAKTGDYDTWRTALIWATDYDLVNSARVENPITHEIKPYGEHYALSTGDGVTPESHWMSVSNYHTDRDYTFYVSGDFTELWVEAEYLDIFITDYLVGNNQVYDQSSLASKTFTYDPVNEVYTYVVPKASGWSGTIGDFQISTRPGTVNSTILSALQTRGEVSASETVDNMNHQMWRTGLIWATDYNIVDEASRNEANYIVADGTEYDLTLAPKDQTESRWMSVKKYSWKDTEYTIHINKDLTKMWVTKVRDAAPLYIIGHLTGGYGYELSSPNIKEFDYDPVKDEYTFTKAGARWSVFEVSTNKTGYYDAWVNGMRAFMPTYDSAGEDSWGTHAAGDPITQPVLQANPFNLAITDPNFIKYPLTKGDSSKGDAGKRDASIEAFNPDWLYTVHVSGDLDYIWLTEQPINMPLKAVDFYDDTDPNNLVVTPHYFVVGTRTADWRLLPEWELTNNGTDGKRSLSGRFMYDGYFGIAKVDSYLDYIQHKYTLYVNADAADQDIKISAADQTTLEADPAATWTRNIGLTSFGAAEAFHYDGADRTLGTSNSITWDTGVGSLAATGGVVTAKMMRYALPFRLSNMEISLDANGVPTTLSATGTYHRKVINSNRTFSIMGDGISYAEPFNFSNALGVRDLRDMTSAIADAGTTEKNWANAWISFDEDGTPYYDAFQNTLFLTAYDKAWLSSHPVKFHNRLGGSGNEEFTSDRYTFTLANPDDATDEFAWIYKQHPQSSVTGSSDYIGWNGSGYNTVTNGVLHPNDFTYEEHIANYSNSSTTPADHTYTSGEETNNYAPNQSAEGKDGWVCYVLKDVTLNGQFIVTSGWSGNIATAEGHGATGTDVNVPRNNLRLYFGNFSPKPVLNGEGHWTSGGQWVGDTWSYDVKGQDFNSTYSVDASDNPKLLYRTYRDVDESNFRTEGGEAQTYKRIILWQNTNVDRKTPEIANGVIQFVQETISPEARAYRQDGKANMFYVNWGIIDRTTDHSYNSWPIVSYQVTGYRYVSVEEDGQTVMKGQLYHTFDPVYPEGASAMTVGDRVSSRLSIDDPTPVPSGTYYYTVTVTIQNPSDPDDLRTRTATTNTLTVSDQSKPIVADLYQQRFEEAAATTEAPVGDYYSFNVRMNANLTSENDLLSTESSHETSMWKDISYLSIKVDAATAALLNNATSVEIRNIEGMQATNRKNTGHGDVSGVYDCTTLHDINVTQTQNTYGYVGWGLDPDYAKDAVSYDDAGAGIPMFKQIDESDVYEIRFKFQPYMKSSSAASDYWAYANTLTRYRKFELPQIIWHNVQPTENISVDLSEYAFDISVHPAADKVRRVFINATEYVDKSLEDYWTQNLGFVGEDVSTEVYAPSMTFNINRLYLTPSSPEIADLPADWWPVNGTNKVTGTNLPSGSFSSHGVPNDPVMYTDLNEWGSELRATIPLTNEVLDNHDVTGTFGITMDSNPMLTSEFSVNKAGPGTSVSLIAHNMPFHNSSDLVVKGQDGYSTHRALSNTSRRFIPSSHANYVRKGANPYTVTSISRRGNAVSYLPPTLNEMNLTLNSQHADTYFIPDGDVKAEYTYDEILAGTWYSRLLLDLAIDVPTSVPNGYIGFNVNNTSTAKEITSNTRNDRSQEGGHPIGYGYANSGYTWNYGINGYKDWDPSETWATENNWSKLAFDDTSAHITLDAGVLGSKTGTYYGPLLEDHQAWGYPRIDVEVIYPIIPSDYFYVEVPVDASSAPAKSVAGNTNEETVKTAEILDCNASPMRVSSTVPTLANGNKVVVDPASLIALAFTKSYQPSPVADDIYTGIEPVTITDVSNGPTEYYTIQGIRVPNPIPGEIYIVRRGSKTTRELFR